MRKLIWAAILALTILSGCTTIRKTIDSIIEGRSVQQDEQVLSARPERPPQRVARWAF
ncbi:MAG: hypothetical protein V3V62_12635 [bacterium]